MTGDDTVILDLDVATWGATSAEAWVLGNPTLVEAHDADTVPEGTSVNGLSVDTTSAASIHASVAAMDASAVGLPVVNGVVSPTVGPLEAVAVRLGGP